MTDKVRRLMQLMSMARNRRWIAAAIISLTAILVGRFFYLHPEYLARLRTVPPLAVMLVVLLNIPTMAALAWAYDAILRLCGKPLGVKENAMLTAYSSIANFFGPLQSGPGVRAVYLKAQHQVRIRDYTLATLIYYGFFASISACFLLAGMRPWWQTLLAVLAAAGCSAVIIRWFRRKEQHQKTTAESHFRLRAAPLAMLGAAVFLQLAFIAAYYYVELKAVNPSIQLGQAISYSGAANFALFVSLTPDAVGFREAFLIFSQHIHHVSTADIVNANILDRGSYVIYLLLLGVVMLAVHARDKLQLNKLRTARDKTE